MLYYIILYYIILYYIILYYIILYCIIYEDKMPKRAKNFTRGYRKISITSISNRERKTFLEYSKNLEEVGSFFHCIVHIRVIL